VITRTSTPLDVSTSSSTDYIEVIDGQMSIQPILSSVIGDPTYTVEMSNDGSNFVCYTRASTNVAIAKSIEITHGSIPWKYIRFSVTPVGGSTGYVYFNVTQIGNN
jgi:hypothetical protein